MLKGLTISLITCSPLIGQENITENPIKDVSPPTYVRELDIKTFEKWALKQAVSKNVGLPPEYIVKDLKVYKQAESLYFEVSGMHIAVICFNAVYQPASSFHNTEPSYFIPTDTWTKFNKDSR